MNVIKKKKMVSYDELTKESKNFFNYIIKHVCDLNKEKENEKIIEEVFSFILTIENELYLFDQYIFAENLFITYSLIDEKIKEYKRKKER